MNQMKILLSILLASSLCFASETWVKGIVKDVIDGDTFWAEVAGQVIKYRMYGIDAPEKDQHYGKEASEALKILIEGKEIRIHIIRKGAYGRPDVEPWLGDTLNISLWMLKNGYAWWSKKHSKKRIDYKEAHEDAKAKKLGLWTNDNPIAPWDSPSRQKNKKKNNSKKSKNKKSNKN